ncbi:hypothetical protein NDU88_002193 [Pleurodeles waltl]|uniref:Secreted protein n=1 Tax=Pleurodeles waltl TaxID=8319 RepID=A0AAV7VAI7_PLEWA|nr:hypothetical protein NDU88_002193 [Pleurodeles waltl]
MWLRRFTCLLLTKIVWQGEPRPHGYPGSLHQIRSHQGGERPQKADRGPNGLLKRDVNPPQQSGHRCSMLGNAAPVGHPRIPLGLCRDGGAH